jgi:enoyl-CoA hydratase
MTKTFSTLHLDIGDRIAHIRLSRPEHFNRFDGLAHVEFADALDLVAQDASVRALLLSAEGKVFSAGGDFDEIVEARDSMAVRDRITRDARRVFRTLVGLPFPVIAAVQGAAVGMGATLMTLCDIVVAHEAAKISDPHVAIGLVAGDGGIVGWSQSIGLLRAKRLLLTGDHILARDAHAMGLVSDLVASPEQAVVRAREIAQQIAALPRAGVEGTKRAFIRLTEQVAQTVFELGLAYEMESITRPEVAESISRLRK